MRPLSSSTAESASTPPSPTIAVHRADVIDLVARAVARDRFPWLGFSDPAAVVMAEALDVDPRADDDVLRRSLVTTILVDSIVRDFFERHPDGLALAVWGGLCTRFWRIDNERLRWIDVDAPAVARFKAPLQPSCERHVVASSCSFECQGWLACLREARDIPTMIVAQGLRRRVRPAELDRFFVGAAEHLPRGVEIVIDYDASAPLRPASLEAGGSCLDLPLPDGSVARYPRLRFVDERRYPAELAHALSGLNGVSRLFRGRRGMSSLAHLHLA